MEPQHTIQPQGIRYTGRSVGPHRVFRWTMDPETLQVSADPPEDGGDVDGLTGDVHGLAYLATPGLPRLVRGASWFAPETELAAAADGRVRAAQPGDLVIMRALTESEGGDGLAWCVFVTARDRA